MDYKDNEELIKRYRNGETNLKNQIIENNLLLVKKIANSFAMNHEDLFQVGCLGLMNALENYGLDSGTKFSTYAYKNIYCFILKYINSQRYPIYLPAGIISYIDLYSKYKKMNLSDDEIMEKMNLKPDEFKRIKNAYDKVNDIICLSLDQNYYDDTEQCTMGDMCKSNINVEDEAIQNISEERLFSYLENILNNNDYNVIYMYYKKQMTEQEIANYYGVSRQLVHNKRNRVLRKLKKDITVQNLNDRRG